MTMEVIDLIDKKLDRLRQILLEIGSGLVAVSGGVDSSILLALAKEIPGVRIEAATAKSAAHPIEETELAAQLCQTLGVTHHVLTIHELENPRIRENGPDRCYHCKKSLYLKLDTLRVKQGLSAILDGSNFDDKSDYRPGMRAIREIQVRCPLMEAGLTKSEIRDLAKERGLLMWDAPASACLFTRIPTGEPLEIDRLKRIDAAERYLHELGFRQIRVRDHKLVARLEIPLPEFARILEQETRQAVIEELRRIGYRFVALDLAGYLKGSMDNPRTSD